MPVVTVNDTERWTARLWGIVAIVSVVVFLDGLDESIVFTALPSIGAELGLTTSSLQWIVSGYVLGYGGLLLLGGRTADLFGRRRVFLIALAVFATASLLGGLVDSGPLLIVTRFVKGVAAAFTAPTGLSIITTTFAEGRARNKAISIYTVFLASGYSFGLVFSGLITGVDWRWTFLLPALISFIALIAGYALLPNTRPAAEGRLDVLGALTSTAAMLLLVYDLVSARDRGWDAPLTLALLAAVIVLLAAFVVIELRAPHPLIRLAILRKGSFFRANLAIVGFIGSYFSYQFILTIYLQGALGWKPLMVALALLPTGLLVALGAPYTGKKINRLGTAPLIVGGMAAQAAGYLLILPIDTHPGYVSAILPTAILIGIGLALGWPAANVQAQAGVDDNEKGVAAGIAQTAAQLGIALTLAITTAIIAGGVSKPQSPADTLAAFRPGLVFVTALPLAGLTGALVLLLLKGRRPDAVPAPVAPGSHRAD
jgi:MFS family permease